MRAQRPWWAQRHPTPTPPCTLTAFRARRAGFALVALARRQRFPTLPFAPRLAWDTRPKAERWAVQRQSLADIREPHLPFFSSTAAALWACALFIQRFKTCQELTIQVLSSRAHQTRSFSIFIGARHARAAHFRPVDTCGGARAVRMRRRRLVPLGRRQPAVRAGAGPRANELPSNWRRRRWQHALRLRLRLPGN